MFKLIKSIFCSQDLAIDLGTANTIVYVKNQGIVLNEPSVAAKFEQDQTMCFGQEAKLMLGRTPHKIDARRPLKDGVIAEFKFAEEMIKYFIRKVNNRHTFVGPMIIICVPYGSTPVDRKAIREAAENAGGNPVYLIEEPMAAAIGVGLPVEKATGSMIVDIGGGTSEIAIISLGGIVYGKSIRVGGDAIDENIVKYIRQHHNLLIGETTAEQVKFSTKALSTDSESQSTMMSVKGRDLTSGVPKEIDIVESDIKEALMIPIKELISGVKIALENMPPELASDIVDNGITLTGGGSLLYGLDEVLSKEIKLPINKAENPLLCVGLGTGKVLENFQKYKYALVYDD